MMSQSFGQWLKQQRRALGLSQKELAQKVGCSAALIRKIEAGERSPPAKLRNSSHIIWTSPGMTATFSSNSPVPA
jgi:transcriptional regulator with XRE-family HTH domain